MVADRDNGKGKICRFCTGHVYTPDGLPCVGTVDLCGFSQCLWNRFKVLAEQEDSHGTAVEWKHHTDLGVDELQIRQSHEVWCDQNVIWDNDLHKDHSKYQRLSLEIQNGQRIGSQSGSKELYGKGAYYQCQGVDVIGAKWNSIPYIFNIVQCKRCCWEQCHMEGWNRKCGSDQPDKWD